MSGVPINIRGTRSIDGRLVGVCNQLRNQFPRDGSVSRGKSGGGQGRLFSMTQLDLAWKSNTTGYRLLRL